jgi:hypothetical protein
MARTPPKAKPTRKNKVVAKQPARKAAKAKPAARKAAKAKAPARKAAKPAKAKQASKQPKPVHDAAHEHHMDEIRQKVARRRPGMAPMVPHMHEQQDASIIPPPSPPPAPTDQLHQNWGDTKQKAVTRLDKPTNWFRQAAKPKSK